MRLDEAILTRRSIRRYENRDVPDRVVTDLLDLCRRAPSSMNGQPWCFIVVRDRETKRRLAEVKNAHCPVDKNAYSSDFLAAAPVIVVIGVERARAHDREKENATLAAAHLMLAAADRGLGSVFLTAYRDGDPALNAEIAALLGLPEDVEAVALVPLGYPGETPGPKELRPLADMIHDERYGHRLHRRD
jgi:nitroreductase